MNSKPVEIEFLMRDKLSEGLDKAGEAATSMGKSVDKASEEIKKKIEEQKTVIKSVEDDLKTLEEQYARMAPGEAQEQMRADITACKQVLEEEKAALAGVEEGFSKKEAAVKKVSAELKELNEAMVNMRLEGKELSPEYEAMAKRAAELADALGDVRTQTSILSDDNAGLKGVMSGLNGAAGSFTAVVGAAGLFVKENEDLVKIQTKLQSVIAITIGLQQVMNTLNKDSAFRLVTVTKAKNLLSTATTRLAVALGISNVAAKALMATLTLGLSVAIGVVIALWDKFSSAQAKAKKEAEEFGSKVSEIVSGIVPSFKKLVAEWEKLPDSMEAKQKFIDKNQEAFKKLGVKIREVKDAENLLIDNKDNFIKSIMLKAKAAAAMEMAADKYKIAIEKMMEADKLPDKVTRYVANGQFGGVTSYEVDNSKKNKLKTAAETAEAEAEAFLLKSLGFTEEQLQALAEAGITTTEEIVAGSVADIENIIANKRAALKDLTDPKEYAAALKEIQAEEKKLKAITGEDKKTPDKTKETNNLGDLELKARQKIEDQALALRKEGYDKQREAAKLNHEREIERINKEEKERLELYEKLRKAGVKVDPEQKAKIQAQATTQRIQAGQLYDNEVTGVNTTEAKDKAEALKKLLEPYRDFAQQRIDIEKKLNDDIEKIRKEKETDPANASMYERAIVVAEEEKTKALEDLDLQYAQKDEMFRAMISRIGSMGLKELETALEQAEAALKASEANGGSKAEQTAVFRAKVTALKNEIKTAKAEAAVNAPTELQKWNRTSAAVKKCKGEIDGIIDSMDFLDESTQAALKTVANVADGAVDMIDGIKLLALGAAESISAVEKASVILAIIGAAVKIMTAIFSMASAAEKRHQEALREIQAAKIAYQREYNLLLLQQNLLMEEATTIFGEKQIAKAANAIEVYRQAIADYKAELQGSKPQMTLYERWTNDALGSYAKRMKDFQDGIGALAQAQIVTGHKKTGLFGWGKGKDLYSSILSVYPELIDKEGRLNTAMAETILNTQKMDDSTKDLINSLIDLQNQADEALESLREYLQDTFGGLGSGIMDSIEDAIINKGNNAWETFGQTGAAVLEDLGKQLAYSLFFADKFAKLQTQLEEIYGSGKSEEQIANDAMRLIGNFYNGIGADMDAAQSFMEEWQKKAKQHGFDLWTAEDEGTTQTGKAGGFQTLTQDQGTKLEGLFTSVQMHVASIVERLISNENEFYTITHYLEQIAENTAYCKHLFAIAEDIQVIRRDGLKMK